MRKVFVLFLLLKEVVVKLKFYMKKFFLLIITGLKEVVVTYKFKYKTSGRTFDLIMDKKTMETSDVPRELKAQVDELKYKCIEYGVKDYELIFSCDKVN